jgi:hypothetical protein
MIDRSLLNKDTLKYADETFEKLGEGTSRVAYDLGDGRVLKVAKTDEAKKENIDEIAISRLGSPLVFKTYDAAEDGSWMIVEKLLPVTNDENVNGFALRDLTKVINAYETSDDFESFVKKNGLVDLVKTDLFKKYVDFLDDNDLDVRDLMVVQNWGKTLDGRVVIADAGLTRERFHSRFGIVEDDEQVRKRLFARRAAKKYVKSLNRIMKESDYESIFDKAYSFQILYEKYKFIRDLIGSLGNSIKILNEAKISIPSEKDQKKFDSAESCIRLLYKVEKQFKEIEEHIQFAKITDTMVNDFNKLTDDIDKITQKIDSLLTDKDFTEYIKRSHSNNFNDLLKNVYVDYTELLKKLRVTMGGLNKRVLWIDDETLQIPMASKYETP